MPSSPSQTPVELAKRIATEAILPNSARWDEQALWPEEAIRALQVSGLGGLVIPREHGGRGQGLRVLIEVCETLGNADASAALCFGMHSVAAACLSTKASAIHTEEFLRPIARGEHWTTLALSETGTGSHFYVPEASMVRDGENYVLGGKKCFVTSGGHADSYVVSTAPEGEAEPGEFSLVMVPSDAVYENWTQPWEGWGMRANVSCSLTLDDVRVPVVNRLGDEGDQLWYVFNVVAPYFLAAMAGTYLGIAGRAFEVARAHLESRSHSHTGASLSEVQVLQHRLGTLWAQLQRTRRLCYWAAEEGDASGPDALPALCSAKAEVAHAVVNIVNEAMTLTGGQAYRDGSLLQRLLRDARAAHIMSPTTDLLYTWTGRSLMKLPLLGV